MKNKDATIIKFLIELKNEELNILTISKRLSMDYKNVHSIIKRLEKEKILKLERFGSSNRVRLIPQIHPLIFEAEYLRNKEVLRDKNLAVMMDDLNRKINSKLYLLLLFGSYAKKTQTQKSDIDLMFIVADGNEETFEKEVHQIIKSLPLPIHYLVFSEKQFQEMKDAKEPNVGQEALKDNIILSGIEIYYRMKF